jgi:RHS repeat-associated protein
MTPLPSRFLAAGRLVAERLAYESGEQARPRRGLGRALRICAIPAFFMVALPVSAQTWTQIAVEGQSFTVSGTKTVRYGANSSWVQRQVTGAGECSNAWFGSDPIEGTVKRCDSQDAAPTSGFVDGSFETPSLGSAGYAYGIAGGAWTFSGDSGLTANNSAFTSGNPNAPDGSQAAFIQLAGKATQSFTLPAGTYAVAFKAALRGNHSSGTQSVRVSIDGVALGTFQPPGTAYAQSPAYSFTVAGGTRTLELAGVGSGGNDYTAFVDSVTITAQSQPGIADGSFEAPVLAGGAYSYNATGSAWTFSGESGLTTNGNGFTAGNPNAPDGAQAAFLQRLGSISQTVTLAAGSYALTFRAAQRGQWQYGDQVVRVSVNGGALGTFQPPGTAYSQAPSFPFTVSSGAHTIELSGVGSGSDYTAFVDLVSLQASSVASTTISLSSSANPVAVGQSVQLTATVSGAGPTGTVTFNDGATAIGTATLSGGAATLTTSFPSAGNRSLTASYAGDAGNSPSVSAALSQAVSPAAGAAMTWLYEYDAEGNVTKVTDPNANATLSSYDRLQRRTQIQQPPAAAAGVAPVIGIGYDGQDRVGSVTDPRSLITSYGVDGLGNIRSESSPDAGSSASTFDAAGNLLTWTDARGKVTTYTYDALNRVKTISYQTGTGSSFEWDGGSSPYPGSRGRLTKMTDESGVTAFSYDALSRLTSRSALVNGKLITTLYSWGDTGSATDKVTSITYPSKARVNYAYDAVGRIVSISVNPPTANGSGTNTGYDLPLLAGITYTADNQIKGWTWANHAPYQRAFDSFGRLTSYPVGYPMGTGHAAGLTRTLGLDNAGRILGYSHTRGGVAQTAFDQVFGYDGLDRLTQQVTSGASYGYSYDQTGNRTAKSVGGASYANTVSLTSHRLINVQSPGSGNGVVNNAQSYLPSGQLIGDGNATYAYSDRGRMSSSTVSGITTSYRYNAFEQRMVKSGAATPSGAAYFAYDEAGQTLGEYDAGMAPITETVYIGTTPVAVLKLTGSAAASNLAISVGNVYADHIDTPRAITRNTDEVVLWRWDGAEAFGASSPLENPSGLSAYKFNQRFPGQSYDQETGTAYNWHRDYLPHVGRYAQSDPIGLAGGINTFAYVEGDPLHRVDLTGLGPTGEAVGGWIGMWGGRAVGGALGTASPLPGGAIVGSIGGSVVGRRLGSAIGSALEDFCSPGNPDPCEKLNADVQKAKDRRASLVPGGCETGMSRWQLQQRHDAWLDEATARAKRDQKCWAGGDAGHQLAQAAAWSHVGQCSRLLK